MLAANLPRLEYIATGMAERNIVPRTETAALKGPNREGGVVKLPQSNEMSALIFQPSLVRRPTVASMLITLIVSWRGLNIKISFSLDAFDSNFGSRVESPRKRKKVSFLSFLAKDSRKFRLLFLILLERFIKYKV